MSNLPPALAARLAARGLLKSSQKQDPAPPPKVTNTTQEQLPHHHEEVIAEDYDEPQKSNTSSTNNQSNQPINNKKGYVAAGCPNKSNIYHDCGDYCEKRWGAGQEEPSEDMKRKFKKILKRYPLPEGWMDVWDPGMGTFYFWNYNTDQVSWLPPLHPKASVSFSAEKMKTLMRDDEEQEQEEQEEPRKRKYSQSDSGSSSSDEGSDESEYSSDSQASSDDSNERKRRYQSSSIQRQSGNNRFQPRNQERGRPRREAPLDPMDPASYSDIPRGSWSDGLGKDDDQTGVDSTASGPLYQQRPLPPPGAVLRRQKK